MPNKHYAADDYVLKSKPTPSMLWVHKILNRLDEEKRLKEATAANKELANTIIDHTTNVSSTASDATKLLASVKPILHTLKFIALSLPVVGRVITFASILINFFKIIIGVTLSLDDQRSKTEKITGAYEITAALVGITFAILTIPFTVLAPFVITVMLASDMILNLAKCVTSFVSIFVGDWPKKRKELADNKKQFYKKLTSLDPLTVPLKKAMTLLHKHRNGSLSAEEKNFSDKNKLTEIFELDNAITKNTNECKKFSADFSSNAHDCMKNIAAELGSLVSMINPLVGAIMLAATAIYSIADRFGYNPFSWLGNKLFDNPFKPDPHHSTIREIEKKAKKQVHKQQKIVAKNPSIDMWITLHKSPKKNLAATVSSPSVATIESPKKAPLIAKDSPILASLLTPKVLRANEEKVPALRA